SENNHVWKSTQHCSASPKFVNRKLLHVLTNPLDSGVEFVQEHFRSPCAVLFVPVPGRLCFFQGSSVDLNEPSCQRSSLVRNRRRGSCQGMSSTAPLSIC